MSSEIHRINYMYVDKKNRNLEYHRDKGLRFPNWDHKASGPFLFWNFFSWIRNSVFLRWYPDKSPLIRGGMRIFFPTRTSRLRYYSIRFINVRFCWLFSNIVNLIRRKWSIFDVLKSQLSHAIYDNDFGFGFLDIKIMKI